MLQPRATLLKSDMYFLMMLQYEQGSDSVIKEVLWPPRSLANMHRETANMNIANIIAKDTFIVNILDNVMRRMPL